MTRSVIQAIPGTTRESAVSVSTLNESTRELVEREFGQFWIKGEISDFKRHRNGHWYFSLRDRVAQIACVVWSRDQHMIPAPPDDGMQIVALAEMTVRVISWRARTVGRLWISPEDMSSC